MSEQHSVNDEDERRLNLRLALAEAACTGNASGAFDRNAFPRGARPALAEAERTARAAKRTFTTAGWLIGGGPLGMAVSAAAVGDEYAFVGVLVIGVPVALMGFCVLPFAFALRAKAKRKFSSIDLHTQDHSEGMNPPEWHNWLGTAPLWRKPGDSR